jgi:uncharacterized protein YjiS (DUF1127 family)
MFRKLMSAFALHSNYKRTYNELSRLTTRELNDIGIDRTMIAQIALDQAVRDTRK